MSLVPANKESKWPKPKKEQKNWGGENGKSGPNQPKQRGREKKPFTCCPPPFPPPTSIMQQTTMPPPSSLVWWRGGGGGRKAKKRKEEKTHRYRVPWSSSLVYTTNIYFSSSSPGHSRIYAESENAFPCTYKICSARLLLYCPVTPHSRNVSPPREHKMDHPPPPLLFYLSIIRRAFFLSSGVRTAATAQRKRTPLMFSFLFPFFLGGGCLEEERCHHPFRD